MPGLRDRMTDAAYGLGWSLICRLPEAWSRKVFGVTADIAWRRQGPRIQVLEGNLRRVLGPGADGAQLRAVSRAAMQSYARYWLEIFRLPVLPRQRLVSGVIESGYIDRAVRAPGGRARGDLRAAAHGQLGSGRRLDHRPRRGLVYHGGRAGRAGICIRAFRSVP